MWTARSEELDGGRILKVAIDLNASPILQALFFACYNRCRKHEAIHGQTPAMAAGLTSKGWSVRELLKRAAQ